MISSVEALPIQARLRHLGLPLRASTRNPVDIGGAGRNAYSVERLVEMARILLSSDEVDALILHGFGRPGFVGEKSPLGRKVFLEVEKRTMQEYDLLPQEMGKPVILGCCLSSWESQAVSDLQKEEVRFYHRLDEIAQILFGMYKYWRKKRSG